MAQLTHVLRFRLSRELKEKFHAIAAKLRRKPSDLARIVIEDYVEEQLPRLKRRDPL